MGQPQNDRVYLDIASVTPAITTENHFPFHCRHAKTVKIDWASLRQLEYSEKSPLLIRQPLRKTTCGSLPTWWKAVQIDLASLRQSESFEKSCPLYLEPLWKTASGSLPPHWPIFKVDWANLRQSESIEKPRPRYQKLPSQKTSLGYVERYYVIKTESKSNFRGNAAET